MDFSPEGDARTKCGPKYEPVTSVAETCGQVLREQE
jgi:hypothetical protein